MVRELEEFSLSQPDGTAILRLALRFFHIGDQPSTGLSLDLQKTLDLQNLGVEVNNGFRPWLKKCTLTEYQSYSLYTKFQKERLRWERIKIRKSLRSTSRGPAKFGAGFKCAR